MAKEQKEIKLYGISGYGTGLRIESVMATERGTTYKILGRAPNFTGYKSTLLLSDQRIATTPEDAVKQYTSMREEDIRRLRDQIEDLEAQIAAAKALDTKTIEHVG